MITIHEADYPIVTVQFETALTLEDTQHYLARFTQWLSQASPFGIILHQASDPQPEADPPEDPGETDPEQIAAVHQFTVQWAKQHKPQIAQTCVGIALVIAATEQRENRRKTAPKTIAGLFGCPGQVFATQAESRQWLQQQLAQQSLTHQLPH